MNDDSSRLSRALGTWPPVLMLFAAFAGAVITLFAGHTVYRNAVARGWPVSEGRVVASKTFMAVVGENNEMAPRARVDYQYTVGGRTYQATNVSFNRGIGGAFSLYKPDYASRYPKGLKVHVAYDPRRPEHSVIDLSDNPYGRLALGVTLLVAYAAYLFWLHADRRGLAGEAGVGGEMAKHHARGIA